MQHGLEILAWSFWSPATTRPQEWREAIRRTPGAAPVAVPDRAIPSLHRRRMSSLSKMAVQTALEATANATADFLVFSSQHGELARTGELLRSIVAGEELSPASFSQSVHNASAGLYTIIKETRTPATSLAAGAGTFAYGWLEADAIIAEQPSKRVLLVNYDEVLPDEYRPYGRGELHTHALALLLGAAGRGGFTLDLVAAETEEPLPIAPLFLAWALSTAPALRATAGGQGWAWRRLGA